MINKMNKILIIEDEELLRRALTDKFTKENFKVFEASDGKIGLDVALKEHPDLILLDIIMPVMDGMTFLKELRKDDWGANVPVIILTNLSDGEKAEQGASHDVYEYLIKSNYKLEDVVAKVKERLSLSATI
jgi:DNA-binding response OmpR family regulator